MNVDEKLLEVLGMRNVQFDKKIKKVNFPNSQKKFQIEVAATMPK